MTRQIKIKELTKILQDCVENEAGTIVDQLLERYDAEIVSFEDQEDPARPSLCKDEFRAFLIESILDNIEITAVGNQLDIGVGDDKKLGYGEELDEETTDCLKIIGTILQGIIGEYILVTSTMTGGPEGRFGRAFLMTKEQYDKEAPSKGWDISKPIWRFSNFKGIPDFFDNIDLTEVLDKCTKKLGEALKTL